MNTCRCFTVDSCPRVLVWHKVSNTCNDVGLLCRLSANMLGVQRGSRGWLGVKSSSVQMQDMQVQLRWDPHCSVGFRV